MSTLTAIVSDIRQHSPGVLPENFHADHLGRLCFIEVASVVDHPENASQWYTPLPEYAVEAVLRDAMTADIAPHAVLIRTADAYRLDMLDGKREKWFHDSEHGGRTQALHAAWRKARGLTD